MSSSVLVVEVVALDDALDMLEEEDVVFGVDLSVLTDELADVEVTPTAGEDAAADDAWVAVPADSVPDEHPARRTIATVKADIPTQRLIANDLGFCMVLPEPPQ